MREPREARRYCAAEYSMAKCTAESAAGISPGSMTLDDVRHSWRKRTSSLVTAIYGLFKSSNFLLSIYLDIIDMSFMTSGLTNISRPASWPSA
jgi:hypothetical protein